MTNVFSIIEDDILQERYSHLCTYASLLGVINTETLIEKAGLNEGISDDRLNDFQYRIEAESRDETPAQPGDVLEINTDERLDWYLAKRLQYHHELEDVKAQYDLIITSIKSKSNSLDFLFKGQAEAYIMNQYKKTGVKTQIYPHGTCAIRTEKPSWKLDNEDELQAWVAQLPDVRKGHYGVTPKRWERNLDALKADAKAGVSIPGLKYDEGGEKLSLRYPKEEN
jgi:hypothetical protein